MPVDITTMERVNYQGNTSITGYEEYSMLMAANSTADYDNSFSNDSTYIDYACNHFTGSSSVVITSRKIYIYAAVFFVFIGLVGNALSVMVFSSKEMRRVSSYFYLLILAISDSLYLVVVFLTKILTAFRCLYIPLSKMDIFNQSDYTCKLLHCFLDLFSDYSTCLILAFTVERYIAVYRPLKVKQFCTVKRARIVCALLFLFCALSIAPYHYMYIERVFVFSVCAVNPEHEVLVSILYILKALIFHIVPVFSITILNVIIIVHVTRVWRRMKQQGNKHQSTTINAVAKTKVQKEYKNMRLTIMLILISSTYILEYLPILCHFLVWQINRLQIINVREESIEISQIYITIFYSYGFANNFFLYTMSGHVFREQLKLILCNIK